MLFHFPPSAHELWDPSHSSCKALVHAFVEREEGTCCMNSHLFSVNLCTKHLCLKAWIVMCFATGWKRRRGREPEGKLCKDWHWHGWEEQAGQLLWGWQQVLQLWRIWGVAGEGGKWEENFHSTLKHLVLPGLRSQGEGAEPLEPAWEQVGEGAAVICSRRSLATTWSRWKAGYHCSEPPSAAPLPPQLSLHTGSWGNAANSTRELFSRQMEGVRRSLWLMPVWSWRDENKFH